MKKNEERKKINHVKVSIVIFTFILVVLTVFKMILSPDNARKAYGYETMGVYKPENYVETNEQKGIAFKNIDLLKRFEGNFPVSTITKNIKTIFTTNIPEIIESTINLNEKELKDYYNKNATEIKNFLRIDNQTSFTNMISIMRNIDCDLRTEYNTCEFTADSENVNFKLTYMNGQSVEGCISGNMADEVIIDF